MKLRRSSPEVRSSQDRRTEGEDAYLAFVQARLDSQLDAVDGLDSKAGTIIATALAESGFPIALLAVRPLSQSPIPSCLKVAFGVMAALLAFTLVGAIRGLMVREWERYPGPDKISGHRDSPRLVAGLIKSLDKAYVANLKHELEKGRRVRVAALWLAALSVVAIGVSVAVVWPVFV